MDRITKPDPDPTTLTTDALLREIKNLKELVDSQLEAMRRENVARLEQVEHTRLEQKADTQREISAALSAQKEAVNKSEAGFEKQMASIRQESNLALQSLADKITALEARINRSGGVEYQQGVNNVQAKATQAWIFPMIGLAVLYVIGFAIEIILHFLK